MTRSGAWPGTPEYQATTAHIATKSAKADPRLLGAVGGCGGDCAVRSVDGLSCGILRATMGGNAQQFDMKGFLYSEVKYLFRSGQRQLPPPRQPPCHVALTFAPLCQLSCANARRTSWASSTPIDFLRIYYFPSRRSQSSSSMPSNATATFTPSQFISPKAAEEYWFVELFNAPCKAQFRRYWQTSGF